MWVFLTVCAYLFLPFSTKSPHFGGAVGGGGQSKQKPPSLVCLRALMLLGWAVSYSGSAVTSTRTAKKHEILLVFLGAPPTPPCVASLLWLFYWFYDILLARWLTSSTLSRHHYSWHTNSHKHTHTRTHTHRDEWKSRSRTMLFFTIFFGALLPLEQTRITNTERLPPLAFIPLLIPF